MAALFTIADFEDATGVEVLPEDEPKMQFMINAISQYIIDYTGNNFFVIEDYTERCQADYYGIVLLPPPVDEVSSVKSARSNEEISYWDWDDNRTVFNLQPHETVLVTYSGGFTEVPEDIFSLAIDVLKQAVLPPTDNSMTQFTVGDVSEKYFKGKISSLIDDLGFRTLNNYTDTEGTWRLGPRQFNPPNELPTV